MQKLTLSITDYPDVPNSKIVYFEGSFDGYAEETIKDIQSEVDQAAAGSILIFEFSKLDYLNSFAIGQLVSWHNAMNTKEAKMYIVAVNKNVHDIFSVLGIETVFKMYTNLEELKKDRS